jgi:TonB-linked SusC/RagA family outer membrane protein
MCLLTAASAQQSPTVPAGSQVKKIVNGYNVTGQVTDAATRKPLSGVNVAVQDVAAVITDDKGNFKITVPSKTSVLQVSIQGYQYKEVAVNNRNSINVALYEDGFNSVYDLVTLPFSKQTKAQINYSVSGINNTESSWSHSHETVDNSMQGQVSGLNVIRRSGTPGAGANLFLHGFNSINATNQPLYVIDGVIYDAASYGTSIIDGHVNNPLAAIDIKDIDNITVIKDGASYYGSRGANGVILITTAHARELTTRIDFAAYGGYNFTPKNIPVLNSNDYRLYLSDVLRSSGLTDAQIQAKPYMNDNPSNGSYYQYHNETDWQKKTFNKSFNQNYYLKVTGGDNIAKYALSVGYLKNGGVIDSTNLQRYSTRFNADLNLTPKLTANTNLSFASSEQALKDQSLSSTNPILVSLIKAPFLSDRQVSAAGVQSPNLADVDAFNVSNPRALIKNGQQVSKYYRFTGSIKFNYQFSKHHSLSNLTGLTYDKVRENVFIPRLGVSPDTLSNAVAYSRLGASIQRYNSFYNDAWYSYKNTFSGEQDVLFNVGFRYHSSQSEQDYAQGYNSSTDDFVSIGNGVTNLRRLSGDYGKWIWLNTYASANYSLKHKYFLSANVSVDGSSRFGSDIANALTIGGIKYAVLPSVAAGWLLSSEEFLSNSSTIDLLKLRVSYGLTGNDDIGNFNTKSYYTSQNLLGAQGLVLANIANPQLQWELSKKTNLGLDVALFNERLTFSLDVYHNATSKMIMFEPLQSGSGMISVISNTGAMQTNGADLSLNGRIINNSTIKFDAGINISTYKNKVNALPVDNMLTSYGGATLITQVGQPLAMFYGFQSNGVYASAAQASAANLSVRATDGSLVPFKAGDVRFTDVNKDGVIDNSDRVIIGNPNPDFVGSINGRFSWKNISVSALFTFSSGNDVYNAPRAILQSLASPANQFGNVINRWRFEGQVTDVPRASYGDPMGNARFSDRFIEDGSYIRLRTLAINYNLPVKPKFMKYATVYLTGDNLFTATHYQGYDPEFSATGSPLTQGIDTALEPQFRTVQLGLRIGL